MENRRESVLRLYSFVAVVSPLSPFLFPSSFPFFDPPKPNSNAYNMVINKCGGRLYDGLVATVSAHLSRVADAVERASGDALLRELKEAWDRHQKSMQMVRDILMYMDRIYVKHAGRVSRSWFLSTISTVVFLVSLAEV